MKHSKSGVLSLRFILALLIAVGWVLPVIGLLVASLRPSEEILDGWWNLEKITFSLKNYRTVLLSSSISMWRPLLNSFIIATLGSGIPMVLGSIAGYSFARHNIPCKKILLTIIVSLMALPFQMLIVPVFQIMVSLKLLNNLFSVIIMHTATALPWIVFFIMNFVRNQDIAIEEAAKIDGCRPFQILYKIVLPSIYPALLAVFTLQFVWSWIDFFFPLIFLFTPEKYTAVQVIPLLRGHFVANWDQLSAAAITTIIVPLLIFFFLQKYYLLGAAGYNADK